MYDVFLQIRTTIEAIVILSIVHLYLMKAVVINNF